MRTLPLPVVIPPPENIWSRHDMKYKFSPNTAQNKFSIKDFFSKWDQIYRKLQIWSHLLKKSITERFNFFFCAVKDAIQGIMLISDIVNFFTWPICALQIRNWLLMVVVSVWCHLYLLKHEQIILLFLINKLRVQG